MGTRHDDFEDLREKYKTKRRPESDFKKTRERKMISSKNGRTIKRRFDEKSLKRNEYRTLIVLIIILLALIATIFYVRNRNIKKSSELANSIVSSNTSKTTKTVTKIVDINAIDKENFTEIAFMNEYYKLADNAQLAMKEDIKKIKEKAENTNDKIDSKLFSLKSKESEISFSKNILTTGEKNFKVDSQAVADIAKLGYGSFFEQTYGAGAVDISSLKKAKDIKYDEKREAIDEIFKKMVDSLGNLPLQKTDEALSKIDRKLNCTIEGAPAVLSFNYESGLIKIESGYPTGTDINFKTVTLKGDKTKLAPMSDMLKKLISN